MQIVIDLPEDTYIATCNESMLPPDVKNVVNAIKYGIPVQKCHDGVIDYHRAFKIACELLNGDVLYGVDSDRIFEIMMERDCIVANDSYEEYILNHLQELDHGQYAER